MEIPDLKGKKVKPNRQDTGVQSPVLTGHGAAHACNPSTQEGEAGESSVEGHPQLHSEIKASAD